MNGGADAAGYTEWIGIALQLPLLAIFVWFVLKIRIDEKDAFKTYIRSTEEAVVRFQQLAGERDEGWRAFLREEREQRRVSMEHGLASLTELNKSHERNMSSMSGAIRDLAEQMHQHDAAAIERYKQVRQDIHDIGKPPNNHTEQ